MCTVPMTHVRPTTTTTHTCTRISTKRATKKQINNQLQETIMSQAMQQDTISDAIDVATTRVKDQLNATTPKGQTTKTATKPPNATKRKQLFSGKRVRTESKKQGCC